MRRVAFLRPEALAALAGVAFVVLGAHMLQPHASARHALPPAPIHAKAQRAGVMSMRSSAGAVQVATDDMVRFSKATLSGPDAARTAVDSTVVGPLRPKLERSLPVLAAAVEASLAHSRAPAVLQGWPLGYRVLSFTGASARVSIWTLDVGASSVLPLATTGYQTTTYLLRWMAGRWEIVAASMSSGPTPPSSGTSSAQVDAFARQAATYHGYRYDP